MGVSKAFLNPLVRYLDRYTLGLARIAVIGNQSFRCSLKDIDLSLVCNSRVIRWLGNVFSTQEPRIGRVDFFKRFGISECPDFDLFGDPEVKLDLSRPIPDTYQQSFQALLEIGTLEHIIDPLQGLKNFDSMIQDSGIIIHFCPIKVKPNHGYYSLSPQLLFDFYFKNGQFELLQADLVSYYGNYDSFLCPTIITSYNLQDDLAHYRELGLIKALKRVVIRAAVFLSRGTYIGFVVRKVGGSKNSERLVQQQYKS